MLSAAIISLGLLIGDCMVDWMTPVVEGIPTDNATMIRLSGVNFETRRKSRMTIMIRRNGDITGRCDVVRVAPVFFSWRSLHCLTAQACSRYDNAAPDCQSVQIDRRKEEQRE